MYHILPIEFPGDDLHIQRCIDIYIIIVKKEWNIPWHIYPSQLSAVKRSSTFAALSSSSNCISTLGDITWALRCLKVSNHGQPYCTTRSSMLTNKKRRKKSKSMHCSIALDSPHKWPVMWKDCPCHEIIMKVYIYRHYIYHDLVHVAGITRPIFSVTAAMHVIARVR